MAELSPEFAKRGRGEVRSLPTGAGRRGETVGGVVDEREDTDPPGLLTGGDVCEMVAAAISTGGLIRLKRIYNF